MVHFLISSKFSQFFPIKENHQNTFSNITNSRSSFPALFNHFTTGTILRKGVPHITYIQRICPEFVFLMTDRYIATKTVNYENVLVLTPFFVCWFETYQCWNTVAQSLILSVSHLRPDRLNYIINSTTRWNHQGQSTHSIPDVFLPFFLHQVCQE